MSTTFAELAAMRDPQQRGYAFEHYIADLLRREQFEVIHNPGAANGRQVDLFANRGDRHYLVEAKWHKVKIGVGEVTSSYDDSNAARRTSSAFLSAAADSHAPPSPGRAGHHPTGAARDRHRACTPGNQSDVASAAG